MSEAPEPALKVGDTAYRVEYVYGTPRLRTGRVTSLPPDHTLIIFYLEYGEWRGVEAGHGLKNGWHPTFEDAIRPHLEALDKKYAAERAALEGLRPTTGG